MHRYSSSDDQEPEQSKGISEVVKQSPLFCVQLGLLAQDSVLASHKLAAQLGTFRVIGASVFDHDLRFTADENTPVTT
jgi:hypothetical protein